MPDTNVDCFEESIPDRVVIGIVEFMHFIHMFFTCTTACWPSAPCAKQEMSFQKTSSTVKEHKEPKAFLRMKLSVTSDTNDEE
jgi:hypothetical protein